MEWPAVSPVIPQNVVFAACLPCSQGTGGQQIPKSRRRENIEYKVSAEQSDLSPGFFTDGKAGSVDQKPRPLRARLSVILRVQTTRHF